MIPLPKIGFGSDLFKTPLAHALGQYYWDIGSSPEKLEEYIYEEPLDFAMDLMVVYGLAAKGLQMTGKVGQQGVRLSEYLATGTKNAPTATKFSTELANKVLKDGAWKSGIQNYSKWSDNVNRYANKSLGLSEITGSELPLAMQMEWLKQHPITRRLWAMKVDPISGQVRTGIGASEMLDLGALPTVGTAKILSDALSFRTNIPLEERWLKIMDPKIAKDVLAYAEANDITVTPAWMLEESKRRLPVPARRVTDAQKSAIDRGLTEMVDMQNKHLETFHNHIQEGVLKAETNDPNALDNATKHMKRTFRELRNQSELGMRNLIYDHDIYTPTFRAIRDIDISKTVEALNLQLGEIIRVNDLGVNELGEVLLHATDDTKRKIGKLATGLASMHKTLQIYESNPMELTHKLMREHMDNKALTQITETKGVSHRITPPSLDASQNEILDYLLEVQNTPLTERVEDASRNIQIRRQGQTPPAAVGADTNKLGILKPPDERTLVAFPEIWDMYHDLHNILINTIETDPKLKKLRGQYEHIANIFSKDLQRALFKFDELMINETGSSFHTLTAFKSNEVNQQMARTILAGEWGRQIVRLVDDVSYEDWNLKTSTPTGTGWNPETINKKRKIVDHFFDTDADAQTIENRFNMIGGRNSKYGQSIRKTLMETKADEASLSVTWDPKKIKKVRESFTPDQWVDRLGEDQANKFTTMLEMAERSATRNDFLNEVASGSHFSNWMSQRVYAFQLGLLVGNRHFSDFLASERGMNWMMKGWDPGALRASLKGIQPGQDDLGRHVHRHLATTQYKRAIEEDQERKKAQLRPSTSGPQLSPLAIAKLNSPRRTEQ